MESEARALGKWRADPRVLVRVSAGRANRAEEAVAGLCAAGVHGLLSWGLCGGLDSALRPGDVVCCPPAEILSPDEPLSAPDAKAAARAEGWRVVDLESGPVARAGLPAWAIRVVLDETAFALPGPALVPLRADGTPAYREVLSAVARSPWTIPDVVRLARRYGRALDALRHQASGIGRIIAELEGGRG